MFNKDNIKKTITALFWRAHDAVKDAVAAHREASDLSMGVRHIYTPLPTGPRLVETSTAQISPVTILPDTISQGPLTYVDPNFKIERRQFLDLRKISLSNPTVTAAFKRIMPDPTRRPNTAGLELVVGKTLRNVNPDVYSRASAHTQLRLVDAQHETLAATGTDENTPDLS